MFATSVPVAVVPSAPRLPSWKIQTIAPKAALSDSMLSTRALIGSTTLPVSRNSKTSMMAAINPRTRGSRERMASTLSRLVCARPPNSTGRPPGAGTSCRRSSWFSDASENNGTELPMVISVLPDTCPVAANGGPVNSPPTKVPLGADTEFTSGTRDSSAA